MNVTKLHFVAPIEVTNTQFVQLAWVAQNSGLVAAPKSGTSVSAADVNDHGGLGDASHYEPST